MSRAAATAGRSSNASCVKKADVRSSRPYEIKKLEAAIEKKQKPVALDG